MDRHGQKIRGYIIDRWVASGGIGDVYHATDGLQREVVFKFLADELSNQTFFRKLFRQELELHAPLQHPNIIQFIDEGEDNNNIPYMILPYMGGGTLRNRHLRGVPVHWTTTIVYIQQIGEALEYLHAQMILHRDIKLENILLWGPGEHIVVSDLSLAVKMPDTPYTFQVGPDSLPPGEYTYFAPEYTDGKAHRTSDEYSLAVVAYELLAGQPPFLASTFSSEDIEIVAQHLHRTPPLLRPQINIPRAMEAAVMKALAKDPKHRYPTVREFVQALEEASVSSSLKRYWVMPGVLPSQPTPNLQGVSQERRKVVLSLAGLATGAIAASCLAWATVPKLFPPAPIITYEGHKDPVTAVAWLPRSTFLASLDISGYLHVWNALTGETMHVHHSKHSQIPVTLPRSIAWGPKGSVAFIGADQTLNVVNAFTGTRIGSFTPPSKEESMSCLVWSPNQEHLLLGYGRRVLVFDAQEPFDASGFYKQDKSYTTDGIVRTLASSPSSQQVVTTANDQIHIWTAEKAQRITQFKTDQGTVLAVDWSPDRKYIVTGGMDQTVKTWVVLPHAFAPDELLFSSVYKEHTDKVLAVAWSPDGRYIASAGADKVTKIWIPDNFSTAYTLEHPNIVMDVAWAQFISQNGLLHLATASDSKVRVWSIPQKPLNGL